MSIQEIPALGSQLFHDAQYIFSSVRPDESFNVVCVKAFHHLNVREEMNDMLGISVALASHTDLFYRFYYEITMMKFFQGESITRL